MNIILIAPPAAGKGTQSKLICDKYHLTHLSTGDLLREATKNVDEFSKEIKEKMSKGLLISDDVILKLIAKRLNDGDQFVFDGFPRNLIQAKKFDELLLELNKNIDYIFYLQIDKEIAQNRIAGRMVCQNCNNIYNLEDANHDHYCDCGNKLIKREDDTLETFIKRFEIYEIETKPIIAYYKNNNNFYVVNSNLKPEEVFKQIEDIIGVK